MSQADATTGSAIVGGAALVLVYGTAAWHIFKNNRGDKFIECGCLSLMAFILTMAAMKIPRCPTWVISSLEVLMCALAVISIFIGLQQGYRALIRRKSS